MNKLIENVLMHRQARDINEMKAYMASVADVGEPWAE